MMAVVMATLSIVVAALVQQCSMQQWSNGDNNNISTMGKSAAIMKN